MSFLRPISEHFVAPVGDRVGDPVGGSPPHTPPGVARGHGTREAFAAPAPRDVACPSTEGEASAPCRPRGLGLPCADGAPSAPSSSRGVAVLCAAGDAAALGCAVGLALARRERAPCVAVCLWTGAAAPAGACLAPAWPAARRLAAGLSARGHDVRPAGRLVLVGLPPDHHEAATTALRALAAAAAPTVLALGGPRAPALDALLDTRDLVLVAPGPGADPALGPLVVRALAARAIPACGCDVPSGLAARALASAGLTLLPSARRALAAPVEALS
jgi:hypothetical protein